jgi:ankyrin repeat protein
VRALAERGAAVDAVEEQRGQTALMWAAADGHASVVRELVGRGADVTIRSKAGFTALLFAAREGRREAVEALLEAGAPIEEALPDEGVTAFLLAAGNAHYELAAALVRKGADPNAAPKGWAALHQLSWTRKAGVAGSNNPAPEGSGAMTSLEFARFLVANGADPNVRVTKRPNVGVTRLNMIGGTPFLLAARTADADLMRLLVELGADPLATNEDGTTPLMVAAGVGTYAPGEDPGTEAEVLEATRLALELGGDINAVDQNGETAVHGAAAKHAPSVVRFLVDSGAEIAIWNQENKEGFTPLRITEGIHRSMSVISHPATAAVLREIMQKAGVPAAPPVR